MTYASPLSPVARSIPLIDSDGYYSATNLEDLAKEVYEALTTGAPAWNVLDSIITLDLLGAPTYTSLRDFIKTTLSAGRTSGGVISDATAGKVDVTAGTGFIKTTDSGIGVTKSFDWPLKEDLALADNDTNYIYVDYAAGTPEVKATNDRSTIDGHTEFTLGRVYRAGTTLHIVNSGTNLVDSVHRNHERLVLVRGFERASGGVISGTGTRNIASTAGIYFLGANKEATVAKDTSGVDTFTYFYRDGGGGWTEVAAQSQINNLQYDDGTPPLGNLTPNRYGVHWVFIGYDSNLRVVYGQGDYKLVDAENAIVPTGLPEVITEFSILAAKIIIKQNAASFSSVVSAYETLFPISSPADHNDLGLIQGGIADEYYHLALAEHTELTQWLDNVVLGAAGALTLDGDLTAPNIITAGNVDGVDVSTFKTAYDTHVAAGDIHVAHSGVTITAGTGLSGGGTIAASRTINCDITQYTNAMALAHIVGQDPLALTNGLTVGGSLLITGQFAEIDARAIGNAGFVANARTGDDPSLTFEENSAAKIIFMYDSGNNRLSIYNYTSAEYFQLNDGGGAMVTGAFSMGGELDLTGALACIDLNPAGTGSKDIIDITPTAALVAGSTWRGIQMQLGALDPGTGGASWIQGTRIHADTMASVDHTSEFYAHVVYGCPADNSYGYYYAPGEMTQNKTTTAFYSYLSGAKSATAIYRGMYLNWGATTRDGGAPQLRGLEITLPASYTDFGACYAAYFSGGGRTVTLCNVSFALYATGTIHTTGNLGCGGDLTVGGGTITIINQGAGADPVLNCNYATQTLGLSSELRVSASTIGVAVGGAGGAGIYWYSAGVGAGPYIRSDGTGFEFYDDWTARTFANIHGASITLNAGTTVNDIDTAMAASPTDDQLLTAQGIKEYADALSGVSGNFTIAGDLQVNGGQLMSAGANIIWDMLGPDVTHHGGIYCNVIKVLDIGYSDTAWDECYADNWNNVSSWKTFADPLAILRTIRPREDDEYEVDHSRIDDWLRSRIKAKAKNEKGFLKWEGGYVLKPEKAKKKARKVYVDRLGKEVPVGNYADGYSDEDFEHENAYSINKTQVVLIQAIKQLEQRVRDLEAGS